MAIRNYFRAVCIYLLFASYSGHAQQCNCKNEFAFLRGYVEKNYPGFKDKTPAYKDINYKDFTQEYETKAASETNMTYCMMYMKEWLRYFKDKHMQLVNNPLMGDDSTILAERIKNREVIELKPDEIKKLKQSKGVEGVYYRSDSAYKVAVIKSPTSWRTYAAVVIQSKNKNWKAGMVKFELKERTDSVKLADRWSLHFPCIFYMDNLGIYANKTMAFNGFSLDGGIWKKEGLKESAKEQADRNKRAQERKANPRNWNYLEFNQPDPAVAYMRVSNFDGNVAQEVDSFMVRNDSVISNTPNLIIDLRDNGGGSDRSFQSILPVLYTNPIVTVGTGALATRDNIDADKASMAKIENPEIKKWVSQEIQEMEENFGRYTYIINDTLRLKEVKKYPEKIVILVNGGCASATEQFLLAAQQSTKVTIIGQCTDGTLDYSNKKQKRLPCIAYTLEYPITRSGRLPDHPVDNIGIKPSLDLGNDDDWVKAAVNYLKTGSIK